MNWTHQSGLRAAIDEYAHHLLEVFAATRTRAWRLPLKRREIVLNYLEATFPPGTLSMVRDAPLRDAPHHEGIHSWLFENRISERGDQISFSAFKLALPCLPTMMWSCTEIPNGTATSMIDCVICTSAREGVGSPEGWLCKRLRTAPSP